MPTSALNSARVQSEKKNIFLISSHETAINNKRCYSVICCTIGYMQQNTTNETFA